MKKLYHSISEVAELTGEEQHILRYWEKEFKSLKPKKNSAGNRKYAEKDISMINQIQSLLRERNLSLTDAKQCIDFNKKISKNNNKLDSDKLTMNDNQIIVEKKEIYGLIDDLKEIVNELRN